jgi:hypothetical protein
MPAVRPEAAVEPTATFRIARACDAALCGAVYYVAAIADGAICPVCGSRRDDFRLSA